MMDHEQREPLATSRSDQFEMRVSPASSNESLNTSSSTRQFWRRLFRPSPPSPSTTSSSSKQFRRRNRRLRDGDDTKSNCSSSSSSQSSSEESETSRKPSREQRLVKYRLIDTTTSSCRPISLIANEGDLTFHSNASETREDNNDDDYLDEEFTGECRDDVGLLRETRNFQSHLLHTPTSFRDVLTDEDRVALLSEHDGLFENRRGSYDVDCVDHVAVSGAVALQKLPLLTLRQELVDAEINQTKKEHDSENSVTCGQSTRKQLKSDETEPAFFPLQIEFPSGDTTGGPTTTSTGADSATLVTELNTTSTAPPGSKTTPLASPKSWSAKNTKPKNRSPRKKNSQEGTCHENMSTSLNPLGEEPSAYSEIIQDRTQRHKAFYLLRLRNSQKKTTAIQRTSPHGDLWTLTELPSEDECSKFSQLSGSLASRGLHLSSSGERSGVWSAGSNKKHRTIMEDQIALIGAK